MVKVLNDHVLNPRCVKARGFFTVIRSLYEALEEWYLSRCVKSDQGDVG